MGFRNLTPADRGVIGRCLSCVASGDVIANDWEFPTLFGTTFTQFKVIAEAWPEVDYDSPDVGLAVNNALNNLLGYPHGNSVIVQKRIQSPVAELQRILSELRK